MKAIFDKTFFIQGERIILALSGGADSSALFHMLINCGLGLKICAVHVHHGLRGIDADDDEDFCAKISKNYSADYRVFKEDIQTYAATHGLSIEEAGREVRYAAFTAAAADFGAQKIVTAHNKNDNAETIIMRFLRGTGSAGLAGISTVRGDIVRPILHTSRAEIIAYLRENNVPYRMDASNDGVDFTRNKIRNLLIPLIEESINPRIIDSLTASAVDFYAESKFVDELAKKTYTDARLKGNDGEIVLSKPILAAAGEVICRRIIRLAYENINGSVKDFARIHVNDVYALLSKETGKVAHLPRRITVRNGRGVLVFSRQT